MERTVMEVVAFCASLIGVIVSIGLGLAIAHILFTKLTDWMDDE